MSSVSSTPEMLDLSRYSVEPHVSQALNSALALSDNQAINAKTALQAALSQADQSNNSSAAYQWIKERFKSTGYVNAPTSDSGNAQNSRWPVSQGLLDSFKTAESFISSGTIWGRDFLTIIFLSNGEGELEEFVTYSTQQLLDALRDEWFRFVNEGKNSERRNWRDWWIAAGCKPPFLNNEQGPAENKNNKVSPKKKQSTSARKSKKTKEDNSKIDVNANLDSGDLKANAVVIFQALYGLPTDGIIGPQTQNVINERADVLGEYIDELKQPHSFEGSLSWQLTQEGIQLEDRSVPRLDDVSSISSIWHSYETTFTTVAQIFQVPIELLICLAFIKDKIIASSFLSLNTENPRISIPIKALAVKFPERETPNGALAAAVLLQQQAKQTMFDPPKAFSAFYSNAAILKTNPESIARWNMVHELGGGEKNIDLFVAAVNTCFQFFKDNNIRPEPSFYAFLNPPAAQESEDNFEEFPQISRFDAEGSIAQDRLNITNDVEAFAMLIAAKSLEPPLAIGLFGDWGSGKTFFMNKLEDRIQDIAETASPGTAESEAFHHEIVQIKFNAWNYVEANLWASLVTHIFEHLNQHFSPKPEDEKAKWQKLLTLLNQSSLLREDAAKSVKQAERELIDNKTQFDEAKLNLKQTVNGIWSALLEHDATKNKIKTLESSLSASSLDKLKSDLLENRESLQSIVNSTSVTREIFLRNISNWQAVGAFFLVAMAALLAIVLVNALESSEELKNVVARIGEFTALVGGPMAWLGMVLNKIKSTVTVVEDIAKVTDEKLKNSPELRAFKSAQVRVDIAKQRYQECSEHVAELKRKLTDLKPSAQLSKFLSDRAESSDYRKHLGLPAMISKDFNQLQKLMNNQYEPQFYVACKDEMREDLNNSKIPREIYQEIKKHDIALRYSEDAQHDTTSSESSNNMGATTKMSEPDLGPVEVETIEEGEQWVIKDEENVRNIKIEYNEENKNFACTIQWKLPKIDRIVLYVDDLDRCPPNRVIEVLQAVHLLLSFRLFVVVVGVDARWVSRALQRHYEGQWTYHKEQSEYSDRGATPHDYLEKIFQIPFWLKPMSHNSTGALLDSLEPNTIDRALAEMASKDINAAKATEGLHNNNNRQSDSALNSTLNTINNNSENDESVIINQDDKNLKPGNESDENSTGGNTPSSSPQVKPKPQEAGLELKQLQLYADEMAFMKTLSPILGRSPRSVKRFVNVYRLYRSCVCLTGSEAASLRQDRSEYDCFFGSATAPGTYRVALFFLAIIAGQPASAQILLYAVQNSTGLATFNEFKNSFLASIPLEPQKNHIFSRNEWALTFDYLNESDMATSFEKVQLRAAEVRRYSFRVGRLMGAAEESSVRP